MFATKPPNEIDPLYHYNNRLLWEGNHGPTRDRKHWQDTQLGLIPGYSSDQLLYSPWRLSTSIMWGCAFTLIHPHPPTLPRVLLTTNGQHNPPQFLFFRLVV